MLKGRIVLHTGWTPAVGALEYQVQFSYDNSTWSAPVVTTNVSADLVVQPATVYLRVAAQGNTPGPWALWHGTASGIDQVTPTTPTISQTGTYVLGDATVEWTASTDASSYDLEIWAYGTLRREESLTADTLSFNYTPAMGENDGGPFRTLTVPCSWPQRLPDFGLVRDSDRRRRSCGSGRS